MASDPTPSRSRARRSTIRRRSRPSLHQTAREHKITPALHAVPRPPRVGMKAGRGGGAGTHPEVSPAVRAEIVRLGARWKALVTLLRRNARRRGQEAIGRGRGASAAGKKRLA